MGTIKADTVTGLADPNKITLPSGDVTNSTFAMGATLSVGSTPATLNFGNTVITNASAGSTTITGEGGSTTTNLQQGLVKCWLNYKGDGTVAIRDSLNFSSVTDENTGIYELNLTNNMGNNDCHLGAFHRSNSQTSGIAVEADLETGKVDDFKTFAGESTLIDREIAGGLIAGDLA